MIKIIKRALRYRLDGIESVIQIGKTNIRFKRKKVLSNMLIQCKNSLEQLEMQDNILNSCIQEKAAHSTLLEKEYGEQKKQINELQKTLILQEREFHLKISEGEVLINSLTDSNEKLKQEKSILEPLAAYRSQYINGLWCSGWISYWKQFQRENYKDMEFKINAIKHNVDEESKETINLFLERNINILPSQEYTEFFLYDMNKLFTEWEKEGMKAGVPNENEVREKYHIRQDVYLETPVFNFHCGLSLLPCKIRERIQGKDVIDGGAFWGDSALVIQEYSPRSIHAFEPMPVNFMQLCETQKKNKLENLVLVEAGLGEFASDKKLYYHEMLSGASVVSYKALAYERPEVHENDISITTIDEYVLKNDLNIGLIKLDVEGSELESIKGAVNTICQYKPILLIAVYHLPKDLFEIKPLIESLNLGYQFMFRKLVFHDPLTEVSLIGYVP